MLGLLQSRPSSLAVTSADDVILSMANCYEFLTQLANSALPIHSGHCLASCLFWSASRCCVSRLASFMLRL